MKSLFKMTLISSVIVLALAGCDDKKENSTAQQQAAATQDTSQTVKIEVDATKEAYAVGASLASDLKNNLEKGQLELDNSQIIKGFSEAFDGKSQYTPEQIQYILNELTQRLQKEAQTKFDEKKSASIAAGDKFREDFAKQPGVKKTESGLLYEIVDAGKGKHPTETDSVIVHYTGTLVDGKKFDSSYDRNEPSKFPLNAVIKGWAEGIELIGTGGKIKLVVPPELAYGDQEIPAFGEDNPGIPPASTLVFEVELLGIDGVDQAAPQAAPAPASKTKPTK
ncbi:FKBP-type peptidyl-prolyl cis-trans isomerase [Orbus wheelerorum]|uniref:FKBP-type peptidyl-prolyl cis-trans isomerase n=1 Tax=Orbus wheelerorum TaxID=3074111 RepID=UPI00370DC407